MKLANLPTDLGMRLMGDMIKARLSDANHVKEAVCAFQRMALVGDLDDSIKAMEYWFKPNQLKWSKYEKDKLRMCHEIVKKDVLGLAIESLVNIATNGRNEKDRLAASTLVNELYGEKKLEETGGLSDKLLLNIVKG